MAGLLQWLVDLWRRLFGSDDAEQIPAYTPPSDPPPEHLKLVPGDGGEDDDEDEEDVSDPPTVLYDGTEHVLTDEDPTFTEHPDEEGYEMSRPTLSKGAGMGDQTHLRDAVKEAQGFLNTHGESLTVDGQFGSGTEAAVKRVQTVLGLAPSGVVDATTWQAISKPREFLHERDDLRSVPMPPAETVSGSGDWRVQAVVRSWNAFGGLISALAKELRIAPSAACAVLAIESAGKGFEDGRQIIRFENHVFDRYKTISNKTFADHFRYDIHKKWKGHMWRADASNLEWTEQHTTTSGQDGEWAVFEFAKSLDAEAAMKSISMGSPQIMGFNHKLIGYETVEAMFDAFNSGDRAHILGLFDFILSDARMPSALRSGDWRAFASIYNGPGQADAYGEHIRKGVEAAKALGLP